MLQFLLLKPPAYVKQILQLHGLRTYVRCLEGWCSFGGWWSFWGVVQRFFCV